MTAVDEIIPLLWPYRFILKMIALLWPIELIKARFMTCSHCILNFKVIYPQKISSIKNLPCVQRSYPCQWSPNAFFVNFQLFLWKKSTHSRVQSSTNAIKSTARAIVISRLTLWMLVLWICASSYIYIRSKSALIAINLTQWPIKS